MVFSDADRRHPCAGHDEASTAGVPGTTLDTAAWDAVEALRDPRRRAMYESVRRAVHPVTRDEVAVEHGVPRSIAAFHLDRLAAVGLVEVDYARPPGRVGPGAGRPSKRYRPGTASVQVSVPIRRYDLAGQILARAVADSPDPAAQQLTLRMAREEGRATGHGLTAGDARCETAHEVHHPDHDLNDDHNLDDAADVLQRFLAAADGLGYEPVHDGSVIRLRNCPFAALARNVPEVVCLINQQFVEGLLEGIGCARDTAAIVKGAPGHCCVVVNRR